MVFNTSLQTRTSSDPVTAFELAIKVEAIEKLLAKIPLFIGRGTPEGVVKSNIGGWYLNEIGSTSTTLYVKESGTGNTGWVAK